MKQVKEIGFLFGPLGPRELKANLDALAIERGISSEALYMQHMAKLLDLTFVCYASRPNPVESVLSQLLGHPVEITRCSVGSLCRVGIRYPAVHIPVTAIESPECPSIDETFAVQALRRRICVALGAMLKK